MEDMFNNYTDYHRQKIREYFIANYSPDIITEKYMEVFNQMLTSEKA
jgi:hypothetical protein